MLLAKSRIPQIGEVIHVVIGKETQVAMSLMGSVTIPWEAIRDEFEVTGNTVLMMTTCDSEKSLAKEMRENKAHFILVGMPSFNNTPKEINPLEKNKLYTAGRCDYCKRDTELVPIPGFSICAVCAQIELGKDKPPELEGIVE